MGRRKNILVEEANHKLKIQEIKKNSSSDVLHTIKRIKTEEAKTIGVMVAVIFVCLCFIGYLIFSNIQDTKVELITSGPLVIDFFDNESGMGDIVSFDGRDSNLTGEDVEIFSTKFNITNNSSSNSWYEVYIDDFVDMIEYDECEDQLLDKNMIYFSVDGSEVKTLASVYKEGKYILMQGIVTSNDIVTHELQVWYSESSDEHFHGKINIKYIR